MLQKAVCLSICASCRDAWQGMGDVSLELCVALMQDQAAGLL